MCDEYVLPRFRAHREVLIFYFGEARELLAKVRTHNQPYFLQIMRSPVGLGARRHSFCYGNISAVTSSLEHHLERVAACTIDIDQLPSIRMQRKVPPAAFLRRKRQSRDLSGIDSHDR